MLRVLKLQFKPYQTTPSVFWPAKTKSEWVGFTQVNMQRSEVEEIQLPSKWRNPGVWATWLLGGASCGLVAICIPFALPALRRHCLPFVPATPIQVEKVLLHLKGTVGQVVDLGSGDGRVVSDGRLSEIMLTLTKLCIFNYTCFDCVGKSCV